MQEGARCLHSCVSRAASTEYLQTPRKRAPKPRQITFPEDRLIQSFFARHPKVQLTMLVCETLCADTFRQARESACRACARACKQGNACYLLRSSLCALHNVHFSGALTPVRGASRQKDTSR